MNLKTFALAAAFTVAPGALHAQFDFHVAGRDVQIHSFGSQGFAYSNENNYLTMPTSNGSFAMTDGGVNVSTRINDKFRVGAQFYIRNVGEMGNFRPELDWALGDYKFADWFGIRAGKVKTTMGLYNDTQDLEFMHTWAILPQSAYPLDLRASTIAHEGGDFYGNIGLRRAGSLAYTAFAGRRPDDPKGGYVYGLAGIGLNTVRTNANQTGGDLRWSTFIPGLQVGASYLNSASGAAVTREVAPGYVLPINIDVADKTLVYYGEYKHNRLTVAGEYRREFLSGNQSVGPLPATRFVSDGRGWWASAAFRVSRKLELGTYHSRFYPDWAASYKGDPTNHIFDQTVTARLDLVNHVDLKIEGHFIDGYGSATSFRGFYPQNNAAGLKPSTDMLVVRMGFNF